MTLCSPAMLAIWLHRMATQESRRLLLHRLILLFRLVVQNLIEQRLLEVERVKARAKLQETERKLSGILYERGVNDQTFAVIRSKGDQALFRLNTNMMKRKLGMPSIACQHSTYNIDSFTGEKRRYIFLSPANAIVLAKEEQV